MQDNYQMKAIDFYHPTYTLWADHQGNEVILDHYYRGLWYDRDGAAYEPRHLSRPRMGTNGDQQTYPLPTRIRCRVISRYIYVIAWTQNDEGKWGWVAEDGYLMSAGDLCEPHIMSGRSLDDDVICGQGRREELDRFATEFAMFLGDPAPTQVQLDAIWASYLRKTEAAANRVNELT